MATAEAASASTGPRYAPDDPTLPQPWKGLIDGSTGSLYYWNPETNITQYEKPASLPPPLPSGPPVPSTPTLAPLPGARTVQPNGFPMQHGQQMPPVAQQHPSQLAQAEQQQGPGPAIQQPGQLTPQHMRPQMYPQQQMPPQGSQIPPQTQMYQGAQMGQPPGYQFGHQQMQHVAYHQNIHTHVQPHSHQRELNAGFSHREDADLQQGTNSVQMPPFSVQPGQAPLFGGSSINLHHQQHDPRFHNQVGSMRGQQPHAPPVGLKMGYEENQPGSEYHFNTNNFNTNKGGTNMIPQQPKLAAIPMARNQQEMMISGGRPVPGPALNGIYGSPSGGAPFPNTDMMRPPSIVMESPDSINLSPAEVYCQKHEITVTGDNVPAPFIAFQDSGFPPEILREVRYLLQRRSICRTYATANSRVFGGCKNGPFEAFPRAYLLEGLFAHHPNHNVYIHSAGFSSPTPIQAQTWPIALQSKDIVAIAKTGSGKTLGYLIPAFMLLRRCRNNPQNGPTVVILAPTRELATQIQDEVVKFGRSSRVSCTCLYGGAPKGPQLKELERGADIVVATPGRLNDILEMKKVDFGQVSLFVLDEADRMLDMGFEPQIRKIVNEIPPRRQTLMYTATWPKEVKKIASDLLVNPVQVNIGRVDELAANKSITQLVEIVPQNGKQRRLEEILRSQERGSKIIIFCSTKRLCDQLARSIGRNFGAAVIHGDKSQGERDWVLSQFRTGKSPILVATDVAARGLDIKDIRVVVNYDFPTGVEDYVHRIGRTGRAGATGLAYTFFSDQDWKYAADLIKVLEGASQAVPKEVREIALRGGPSFGRDRGGGGRWDSGGRGGNRDEGFGGLGGMRDGNFGGRGGMRDGNFGGRGGMRDGGIGGRGGMRGGNFGGRGGMRDGNFGSRGGSRGGSFGGPDRYGNADGRGFGQGRGRGRFDNRRDVAERSRGRSYSSSPDRARTWGRSRSRSYSTSRSRSCSPRRSRSRSPTRYVRRRESKFDQREVPLPDAKVPPESRMTVPAGPSDATSGAGPVDQSPLVENVGPATTAEVGNADTEP